MLTDTGHYYFPTETGQWVSDNQVRVAQVLQDYDPNLQLQWIPLNERGPDDYAFRVVDVSPGKRPYAVCFAHEADERLLARVFEADGTKNGGTLNILERINMAQEMLNLKKQMEERMESHELAYSVMNSSKIHYKHNGIDFGKKFGGRLG
jgi:hypothetical protein